MFIIYLCRFWQYLRQQRDVSPTDFLLFPTLNFIITVVFCCFSRSRWEFSFSFLVLVLFLFTSFLIFSFIHSQTLSSHLFYSHSHRLTLTLILFVAFPLFLSDTRSCSLSSTHSHPLSRKSVPLIKTSNSPLDVKCFINMKYAHKLFYDNFLHRFICIWYCCRKIIYYFDSIPLINININGIKMSWRYGKIRPTHWKLFFFFLFKFLLSTW